MVVGPIRTYSYHLTLREFHAPDMQDWLILIGREQNPRPCAVDLDIHDARQGFGPALHPEAMEPDWRQFGAVLAARRDHPLHLHVLDSRVIGVGIGKDADCARRHRELRSEGAEAARE